jgi:D-alanine-D-alanine ligase-like ATP-grasp enzyme
VVDDLTVFTVFESKSTWEQQNPKFAKCGYGRFLEDDESIASIVAEIRLAGISVKVWPYSSIEFESLLIELRHTPRSILWNLTDGYEFFVGANLPAFVQLANIPHIGSGSYTQMLCQNKHHLKAVAQSIGIASARGVSFNIDSKRPFIIPQEIAPPYFVKPTRLDNSIGDQLVSPICRDTSTALAAVKRLLNVGITDVSVEEFLPGDEFSIVAANGGSWIMECARITYGQAEFFSSTIKDNDICRSEFISGPKEQEMIKQSEDLAKAIKLQDYFRADFRCDFAGNPKLLEVNSNPFLVSQTFDELARRHFGTRPEMFKAIIKHSYLRQRSSVRENPAEAHLH